MDKLETVAAGSFEQAESEYETKAQIARRLGVCERTVDNLMRQRRLPFVRLSAESSGFHG
jgi:hypothetical protein